MFADGASRRSSPRRRFTVSSSARGVSRSRSAGGTSQSPIARLESGKAAPSSSTLRRLRRATGKGMMGLRGANLEVATRSLPALGATGWVACVSSPHDALFKYVFSLPEHAASKLRAVLPAELSARLDWRSLELRPASFVHERLSGREAELLFTIRCNGPGRSRMCRSSGPGPRYCAAGASAPPSPVCILHNAAYCPPAATSVA